MQAIFSKSRLFLDEDSEEKVLEKALKKLGDNRLSLDQFLTQYPDPKIFNRIALPESNRTLLHLAVERDHQRLIDQLATAPTLREKKDKCGLRPLDLARLLKRGEAIFKLESIKENRPTVQIPEEGSVQYLPTVAFDHLSDFNRVMETVDKAKKGDLIPTEKIWLGIYFDKEISEGLHPKVSIRFVNEKVGYGVFAEQDIPSCSFVGEYAGIVVQKSPKELMPENYAVRYTVWGGRKNYAIDAQLSGNFTRYINHSSTGNLNMQSVYWRGISRMIFLSTKEIKKGSQLLFDYGPNFWKAANLEPENL